MKKKLIYLLIVLTLVVSTASTAFAARNEVQKDSRIEELFSQRANLLNEEEVDEKKIKKVEKQLHALGVESISPEEVSKKIKATDTFTPQVTVPNQSNVSWFTYRTEIIKNGQTYEVQRLIAQPNAKSSNLKSSGSAAVSSTYRWRAGTMDTVKSVVFGATGEIPGFSTFISVYDAANTFITGIQSTTWIDAADVVYSWSQTTTVIFFYVKLKGQTDDYQYLKYVTNRVDWVEGWQFPTFTYTDSSGGQVAKPGIVQGQRTKYAFSPGYDNAFNAVDYYIAGGPIVTDHVARIEITGIENKTVKTIYPTAPISPVYIY